MVTHEPETLPWADRVIELSDGKIVSDTTTVASVPSAVTRASEAQNTASLFDDDVLLGGTE